LANEPDAGLTGAAFELANVGYTAMSDPDKKREGDAIGSDVASLREAAERLNDAPRERLRREGPKLQRPRLTWFLVCSMSSL
jgi:hypothetical protein